MKKPKLSEIVWRNAVAIKGLRSDKGTIGGEGALSISEGVQYDIPYLLDLVKRLGKVLESLMGKDALFCDRCCVTVESDGSIMHDEKCFIPEARALLLEIKK